MTSSEAHRLADQIQREEGITHREALSRLGRAGNRAKKNRRTHGVLHPVRADRSAFANVEPPANAWWRREDL